MTVWKEFNALVPDYPAKISVRQMYGLDRRLDLNEYCIATRFNGEIYLLVTHMRPYLFRVESDDNGSLRHCAVSPGSIDHLFETELMESAL